MTSEANSHGGRPITLRRFFAAYDQLPPDVRRALANAVEDWGCLGLAKLWKHGKKRPSELIALIQQADKNELLKRELQRRAGKGVYKGLLPAP